MTGDPTRDRTASDHHFGGSDEPMADEYTTHQRREAITSARDLVAADWLRTRHGDRLHHAHLTDAQLADMDDYRQLGLADEGTDGAFRLACGRTVTYISIPGLFSRMGCNRCARCCDATGLPPGKGSPKNDGECRRLLGISKEGERG